LRLLDRFEGFQRLLGLEMVGRSGCRCCGRVSIFSIGWWSQHHKQLLLWRCDIATYIISISRGSSCTSFGYTRRKHCTTLYAAEMEALCISAYIMPVSGLHVCLSYRDADQGDGKYCIQARGELCLADGRKAGRSRARNIARQLGAIKVTVREMTSSGPA
jgi:hypothetical protein